jgi:poly-gamma-glutamate capsule biosynthesis protein CapA/YwtB (metallophosphatase superfamily)
MSRTVKLFLAGDVMTGRGIDQVLPNPSLPKLYESYVRDARVYVELAEWANGPIARPVDFGYVWGDALGRLARAAPDARIVNLETAVTLSDAYWPGKGVHYRMHPDNVPCLTAAAIDCCVLANNHVLDWGPSGLEETLATLHGAGLATAGAGRNAEEALAPAVVDVGDRGRVLVFAFGSESSGIPGAWAAGDGRAGVNWLSEPRRASAVAIGDAIDRLARQEDFVVVSIHWGGNWGWAIPGSERELAHALVDTGKVDVIHGHSSHHARGMEIYRGKPIFYGCGDFVNDYEGISGHEEYRADLRLAYLVELESGSRRATGIEILPFQSRRLSLRAAADADLEWLRAMLERESPALDIARAGKRRDTLAVAAVGRAGSARVFA